MKLLHILGIILSYLVVGFWLGMAVLLLPAILPSLLLIALIDWIENKIN